MTVRARARAGWEWLKGPEPWTRRAVAGDLVAAAVLVLIGFGIEELDNGSGLREAASAVTVVTLVLLRRRMPAGTLVAGSALGGVLPGAALVTILLGWSAGRRIVGAWRAVAVFALCFLLYVGLSVAVEWSQQRPLLLIAFTTLMYLATVVTPGLASRYWSQRRTLLHALQERNDRLLRERAMVAGQARLLERQRIAQDMHDSLGHQLALISVHTGALEVDPKLTDRQREAVGVLRQASVSAMHELREVVGILRDGVEAPLREEEQVARGVAGIEGVVAAARAAGTPVELRTVGEPRQLAPACDHAAYRIVQEALTNAYKHAPGAAISVELRYEDDSLVVEIANGPAAGPGPGEVVSGGQGLTGLRERARLVGGMVHAGAVDGGGFRVAGVLPYGAEPAGGPALPGAADDFGRPVLPPGAPPMDWAAVDRELVGGRSRSGGIALGCGIAFAAVVLLVIVVGAGVALMISSVTKGMIDRSEYDAIAVGTAEQEVRDRLPSGDSVFVEGLEKGGPPRPAGASCLVLMSTETGDSLEDEPVFRFCFKDGRLVEKQAYEIRR
ncbi:two-component sensor histidine kinase [Streptomyces venezuelae]|uniref:histidine kinase n=1 Tax=Streptomyces venezuelae TaxID=54571 RepID=A0A5P2D4U3_STRVZ|nr:sensor histidine kinase [Streptomyces venezuelae]QES49197.1 two-component sensor histidine kinase [Streptomyces venezuelae]